MTPAKSTTIGILVMVSAMGLFTVKDSFAKIIVVDVNLVQLIWQLMRGLSIVAGVGSRYWALSYIPLADVWIWAGIVPIVATGIFIALREGQRAQSSKAAWPFTAPRQVQSCIRPGPR